MPVDKTRGEVTCGCLCEMQRTRGMGFLLFRAHRVLGFLNGSRQGRPLRHLDVLGTCVSMLRSLRSPFQFACSILELCPQDMAEKLREFQISENTQQDLESRLSLACSPRLWPNLCHASCQSRLHFEAM